MVVRGVPTRVVTAARWVTASSRRVVAVLLSLDFVAHALARLSASGETLLFVSTVTTFLAEFAPFDALGWALGWALYGYVLFETAHRVVPALTAESVDWRLRGFVATATLVAALVVERATFTAAYTGSPIPGPPTARATGALALVAFAVAVGFLLWYDGYPVPTDGLVAALVRSLLWSVAERVEGSSAARGFEAALALSIAAVTVMAVCFLLGCLAVLVSLFFPIPELLLLGWVVVGVAESRSRFSPRRLVPSKSAFDLETRLVVAGAVAGHGLKGLAVVFAVVVGLATTLLVFVIFSGITAALAGVADQFGRLTLRHWAVLLVFLGGTLTYAVFSLWYWLRLLDRAPHFLRRWSETVPSDVPPPEFERERPLVTRPPGYHLPPSVLLLAAVAFVVSVDPETVRLLRPLTAVVVLALGAVVVSAVVAVRHSPRRPPSDGRDYAVSLAVQLGAMALVADVLTGGTVVAGAAALSPGRVVAGLLAADGSTVAALSLPLLFYAPDGIVALDHPPWHRRAVTYFLVLGVVIALIGVAGDSPSFAALGAAPPLWTLLYLAHDRVTG